mgnify:CR=1 FL=1
MSETFSSELTFIPARYPHEIVSRAKGDRLVALINRWLLHHGVRSGLFMTAKLDPHHNVRQPNETWLIEIVPFTHFQTAWLDSASESRIGFMTAIDAIFVAMRDRFDLVPSRVWRKGNTDYHAPQGGCHLMGIVTWSVSIAT